MFLFRVAFAYSYYLCLVLLAGVLHYNFLLFFLALALSTCRLSSLKICLLLLLLTRSLWRSSSLALRLLTLALCRSPSLCSLLKTCRLLLFVDIIAKISRMDSLPNYLSYGSPLARFARKELCY